ETVVALELLAAEVLEQTGRPADVEALLLSCQRLVEERAQDGGEGRLPRAERRLVEPPPQRMTPELEPGDTAVQVLRGLRRKAGIDRLGEAVDPLGDAAGGGDDHHHHDL